MKFIIMGGEEQFQRNSQGDIITPSLPKDLAEELRSREWTYVFHFKDRYGSFLEVNYENNPYVTRTDLPKFNIIEYSLFQSELPATQEWLEWYNNYDILLNRFFAPIFRERIRHIDHLKVDKTKLILSTEKFDAICKFISDYGLQSHKDFIFYLISKIEEVYVHDVEYYERPDQKKQITQFPKEVENLYKVLKWSETNYRNDAPVKPELNKITFHYDRDPLSVKITDPVLLMNITKATIKDLGEGRRKNWEKQLKSYPNVISENQMPNAFRNRICQALDHFFKDVKAFDFGNKKNTDREIEAIAKILDFAHVKFHNNKAVEFDIDVDIRDIKQHVKNALRRKKLVYDPIQFTIKDLRPDFKKLEQYFPVDLLAYGSPIYSQKDVTDILAITDRFNCNEILPNILYIFTCLKEKQWQLGHQFQMPYNNEIRENEDYKAWGKIMKHIKEKQFLSMVNFQIHEDHELYSFKEKLSIELLQQALKEFLERNRFEFEFDFYESKVEPGKEPFSFKLVPSGKLHEPQNRFFPKFTKQCYSYLLNESPPKDNEWTPSERYIAIIALILTWRKRCN